MKTTVTTLAALLTAGAALSVVGAAGAAGPDDGLRGGPAATIDTARTAGPDDGLRGDASEQVALRDGARRECAMDVYGLVCVARAPIAETATADASTVAPTVWIMAAADYAARAYDAEIATASIPQRAAEALDAPSRMTALEDAADAAAAAAQSLRDMAVETATAIGLRAPTPLDPEMLAAASMLTDLERVSDLDAAMARLSDVFGIETATIVDKVKGPAAPVSIDARIPFLKFEER